MATFTYRASDLTDLAAFFQKLSDEAQREKIARMNGRAAQRIVAAKAVEAATWGRAADIIRNLELGSNTHRKGNTNV